MKTLLVIGVCIALPFAVVIWLVKQVLAFNQGICEAALKELNHD